MFKGLIVFDTYLKLLKQFDLFFPQEQPDGFGILSKL